MLRIGQIRELLSEKKNNKIIYISILVSLTLLSILFIYSNSDMLLSVLGRFTFLSFIQILIIFIVLLSIIILRLKFALKPLVKSTYFECIDISILHLILLTFLPARLGDVCYPFILKRSLTLDLSKAFTNLLMIRFYDVLTICILFIMAIQVYSEEISSEMNITLAVLTLIGSLFILLFIIKNTVKYLLNYHEKNNLELGRIMQSLSRIDIAISSFSKRDLITLLIMTSLRWILACLLFLYIFKTLQIDINLAQAVLITTGLNLAVIIPIQTIGGFGMVEAVIAWFLGIFGYPIDSAISLALASRIIWLIYPVIIGTGWLLIRNKILINFS